MYFSVINVNFKMSCSEENEPFMKVQRIHDKEVVKFCFYLKCFQYILLLGFFISADVSPMVIGVFETKKCNLKCKCTQKTVKFEKKNMLLKLLN